MVCTRCGIIGADAGPNWREQAARRLRAEAAGETFDPGAWTGPSSACLGASQQIGLSSMVTRSRSPGLGRMGL
jgi:hypothetical protein